MGTEDRVLISEFGMGVLMEQLLLYLCLNKGETRRGGGGWNDKEGCVCVSLVKGALDTFLVHKIGQIRSQIFKTIFETPLSRGRG